MKISIYDNNTNETGTYKVYFNYNKIRRCAVLSENETNSLLSMRQKEDFFMGKFKFILTSAHDIQNLLVKSK